MLMKRSRYHLRAVAVIIMALSISAPMPGSASASSKATANTAEKTSFDKTVAQVEEVIKTFYPRVKLSKSKGKFQASFKCKKMDDSTGSGRQILIPRLDGILITMELKDGEYRGKEILPHRVNELLYVSLLMAPYSSQEDKHLLTRVLFPHNTPEDFVRQLQSVVPVYEKLSEKTTGTAKTTRRRKRRRLAKTEEKSDVSKPHTTKSRDSKPEKVAVVDTSASKKVENERVEDDTAGDTESSSSGGIDFGGSKLSSYTFHDGRFKIRLPGQPAAKSKSGKSMRFVEYLYKESLGSYKIGYTALDRQVPLQEQGTLLTKLIRSMAQATGGKAKTPVSLPWQGYPGRQIQVTDIPGDGFKYALLRIFLVDRYLYVIQAKGSHAWLNSPGVDDVLSSLTFRP